MDKVEIEIDFEWFLEKLNRRGIYKEEIIWLACGLTPDVVIGYIVFVNRANRKKFLKNLYKDRFMESVEVEKAVIEAFPKFFNSKKMSEKEKARFKEDCLDEIADDFTEEVNVGYTPRNLARYRTWFRQNNFLDPLLIEKVAFEEFFEKKPEKEEGSGYSKIEDIKDILRSMYNDGYLFAPNFMKFLKEKHPDVLIYKKELGWVKSEIQAWCRMNVWTLREALLLCFGFIPESNLILKHLYVPKDLMVQIKMCNISESEKNSKLDNCSLLIKDINVFKPIKKHFKRNYPEKIKGELDLNTELDPKIVLPFLSDTTHLDIPQVLIDTLYEEKETTRTFKKDSGKNLNKNKVIYSPSGKRLIKRFIKKVILFKAKSGSFNKGTTWSDIKFIINTKGNNFEIDGEHFSFKKLKMGFRDGMEVIIWRSHNMTSDGYVTIKNFKRNFPSYLKELGLRK